MKNMSAELKAHYASGTTTIATIVKLTRTDGMILAIVLDHDQDIIYDSVTYKSVFGLTQSAIETKAEMSVDSMDVSGALMDGGMTESDIAAGLWDLCDVRVMRVNYLDLTQGAEKVKRFTFGEISLGRVMFNAECRGITQKLQQMLGDVVSPSCNADLFDTRCGVAATEGIWKFSSQPITAVASNRLFTISGLAQAADFFTAGKITFTSGANTGLSMEIKQHSIGGVFTLQESMPYDIVVTDQCTVYAGCSKRAAEDCAGKFNNIIRFRGFPELPGQDQMFKGV